MTLAMCLPSLSQLPYLELEKMTKISMQLASQGCPKGQVGGRAVGRSGSMASDPCRCTGPQALRNMNLVSCSPAATLKFLVIWNKGWHLHFALGPENSVAAPG